MSTTTDATERYAAGREPYITTRPLPLAQLVVGARVLVPRWHDGDVIGHEEAEIFHVSSDTVPTFVVVRYADGTEQGHYPYSVASV